MFSFTMIEVMIWILISCFIIMFEIPQVLYRCFFRLLHIFDSPTTLHPRICRACGKNGVSWGAFKNKKGKDGKIIWTKYKCVYCGTIHKVIK